MSEKLSRLVNPTKMDHSRPTINADACIGCSACVNMCPTRVLSLDPDTKKAVLQRPEQCISCGHCFSICPVEAIEIFSSTPAE